MGEEATQEVKKDEEEGIDLEDVLMALCIEARTNPDGFGPDSLKDCLVAAGLGDMWEDAGAANEDNDEDDEDDEDDEASGDDGVTDDDEDDDDDVGEGDEG